MEPIKVTAYMQTGKIATTDLYLPLDSIVAFSWMLENHPEEMEVSSSGLRPEDYIIPYGLPFEKRGERDSWYWACSFACGQPKGEELMYYHKRFDQDLAGIYADFQGRRGRVDTGAGHYKNYRMPLVTFLLPKIEWYAVGDGAEIQRLLSRVTHIGKKRSQGFGRVQKWEVEPWHEDLSHLRPIPVPDGDYHMGIRPPYWLTWQWEQCKLTDDRRLACNAIMGAGEVSGTQ